MALVIADRVKETTTTTGTGTVTLLGASTGFQSFAVIGNANTTYYAIVAQTGTEWEVGIGTYTSSGTTLARTTILSSSNSGSAVNFSAGTKDVFVTYPSGKSVNLDASGNATALGTPVSATLTNATGLPISSGVSGLGSNVATFLATPSSANLAAALTDETGTGANVFATSPTLVTPVLGTPSSGTLTSCTGLPISSGVSGLGTGVATFLGTPSSANLASAVTDETGSGALVFATAPALSGATLNDGYTEEVYAVVDAAGVAISPTNGSIQTWTLGASRTPTAGTWAAGQSLTLMIDDGTARTVTWTTLGVIWVGGSAPTLATTGFTVIQFWKVGSTIYGALTGSVA